MRGRKIFVAGHKGRVGSAICRQLAKNCNVTVLTTSRDELDLLSQSATCSFHNCEKPDAVILAAGKVGGIYANNEYLPQFIFENLQI